MDQKDTVTNERFIEAQLVYYYQRMDTQDLITAGGISDIEDGYILLSDLGLRALFSVYCAKGKDIDQFIFKNEMKELGFNNFFAHKVFSQLGGLEKFFTRRFNRRWSEGEMEYK